jgi:hypothetical protein
MMMLIGSIPGMLEKMDFIKTKMEKPLLIRRENGRS